MLNHLLGRAASTGSGQADGKLTAGERDYLDALVVLVEDYDRKHSRFVPSKRTPQGDGGRKTIWLRKMDRKQQRGTESGTD